MSESTLVTVDSERDLILSLKKMQRRDSCNLHDDEYRWIEDDDRYEDNGDNKASRFRFRKTRKLLSRLRGQRGSKARAEKLKSSEQ